MVARLRNLMNKFKKADRFLEKTAKEQAMVGSLDKLREMDRLISLTPVPKPKKHYRTKTQDIMEANKDWIISCLSNKDKSVEIATNLGINPKTLRGWIKRNHIVPGQQSLLFEEPEINNEHKRRACAKFEEARDVITTLLGDGYTAKRVAEMYGCTERSLQNWLFRNNIRTREKSKFCILGKARWRKP